MTRPSPTVTDEGLVGRVALPLDKRRVAIEFADSRELAQIALQASGQLREIEDLRAALAEAVYAVRNASDVSRWSKLHRSRPFDYEDFCVWAEHWEHMHSVVAEIGRKQDEDAAALSRPTHE